MSTYNSWVKGRHKYLDLKLVGSNSSVKYQYYPASVVYPTSVVYIPPLFPLSKVWYPPVINGAPKAPLQLPLQLPSRLINGG